MPQERKEEGLIVKTVENFHRDFYEFQEKDLEIFSKFIERRNGAQLIRVVGQLLEHKADKNIRIIFPRRHDGLAHDLLVGVILTHVEGVDQETVETYTEAVPTVLQKISHKQIT